MINLTEKEMRLLLNMVAESIGESKREGEEGFENYCERTYLFNKLLGIAKEVYPVNAPDPTEELWVTGNEEHN
jgi:hypothetical protein